MKRISSQNIHLTHRSILCHKVLGLCFFPLSRYSHTQQHRLSTMSTKMKRICKSFKLITKIFVTAIEVGAGLQKLVMGPIVGHIFNLGCQLQRCSCYKGSVSGIYVVTKEREMEIGYPTDVKHVAHIGWDGPHGSGPSWMKEFKTAPDFTTSLGNLGGRGDSNSINMASGSTQAFQTDFEQSSGHQRTSNIVKEIPPPDQLPHAPKKQKKKKVKSTTSSSSSRQSRAAISTTFNERGVTPTVKV